MKKLIICLSVLSFLLLGITSCKLKAPETESSAYSSIIRDSDADMDLSEVVKAINAKSGKMLLIRNDAQARTEGEIVFGDTHRAITTEAKKELKNHLTPGHACYLIYKDEVGDVAVVWSDMYAMELAIAAFAENFADLSALAESPAGILECESFELESYIDAKKWGAIEASAPAELVKALKDIHNYYDGSAICDWMIGLWEPYICACGKCEAEGRSVACYGGAFYYANSSRDNEEFLPDIESTVQLLGWMDANGALTELGGYANALPDGVKTRLIKFAQSLEDEATGYFYHPQWGANIDTARRGRDLGWAIGLLEDLGAEPPYPTAIDRLSGATPAASVMTSPLKKSTASSVSAVLAVGAFENSLSSLESYLEWLKAVTKNIETNTDGAHTISSALSQIKAAGYLRATVDYLDEVQDRVFADMNEKYLADPENNPRPTGLWQRYVDYNAVWGLLKFSSVYAQADRELRYAEYAMQTCVEVILMNADAGGNYHMNDVYNQWSAASSLISSARSHNPTVVPRLHEIANEHAVEMIYNSMKKLDKFKQADGTFGYDQGRSASHTQGVWVSKGLPEGDVNATALASSMYRCVFTVLGYNAVPLCDYRDGERFLESLTLYPKK